MAQKKQTVMVLREDGTAAPAVAPTTAAASSFFTDLKQGQTIEAGKDQGALEASGEPNGVINLSPGSVAGSPYAVTSTLSSDTNSTLHPENLPPEATSKGITVTLDNNNMWNEFFRCKTEMILTKQGRRMFPSCRYRISGMEPFQSYLLVMDITPMDSHRYKWSDHRWEPNGKCETHVSGRVFIHPESPASGHYWMQSPVSFYKLKLTNNVMDQEGHVILHSMHRYLPRLHIVPADKQTDPIDVNGTDVMTFIFPQTEFFAVTAYQNLSITQLKIDYNPFAKGFREDASNFRSLMPKLESPSISVEDESKNSSKERGPIKNSLKALFTKSVPVEKNTKEQDPPAIREVGVDYKGSNMQPSVVLEKCIMKRRPSTLSELFQRTPLKLRKTAPESSGPSCILQKTDVGSVNTQGKLDPKETPQMSAQEDVQENSVKEELPSNVTSKEDFKQASDVSHSLHVRKSQTLNSGPTTGQSCVTQDNGQKVTSISSVETVMLGTSEEQSQNKSQKRAGAAALPLLALFFQQLKSKPKPVKLAPKSDDPLLPEHLKSQQTPVNIIPEPDAAGSACSSKGSASPTSVVLKPTNSTHSPESHTQLIDSHNTSTLTRVSSNKTNEDTILDPPSECLTSSKTDDAASGEIFPGIHTSSMCAETHTSLSTTAPTDTMPTTKSEKAKPQPFITSASEVPGNLSNTLATSSQLPCEADGSASEPGSPSSPGFSYCSPAPSTDQEPVDHLPNDLLDIPPVTEQDEGDGVTGGTGVASLVINSSNQLSLGKRPKGRPRKGRKRKLSVEPLLGGGPTDVRMKPNLEDVEGQLFVSFTSKEALEVHLGDDAEESPPPQVSKVMEKTVESPEAMAERITSLEKALRQDLKVMKYKQVIHPVLQEVGLKLNILDQILAIDLLYLGVELPIPPPPQSPGASSGIASTQLHFVSRTGKTTDITKIKGWRDKFVTPDIKETPSEGGTNSDASLKNRSAFCSDMLDEYLASEGKLIDERAASFSTSSVTSVSYQMPTKSSSYVRTLDSVLKKRAPGSSISTPKPIPPAAPMSTNSTTASQTKKPKVPPKEPQKLGASTARRPSKAPTPRATPTTTPLPSSTTATQDALASKKSLSKVKSTPKAPSAVKPLKSETPPVKAAKKEQSDSLSQAGRSVLSSVMKLLEVEAGAVWEGKERTFVTEERASIALAALACATGVAGESKAFMPIIKRRAPPCLRIHCRLGCVCASLVQERLHNHCGKPECMLGCHCLRQKVVLLKPKQEEVSEGSVDSPLSQTLTEDEEGSLKMKRKKKKKKKSVAYVLKDPPATSEPATRVRTLWKSTGIEPEQDELHIPSPVYLPCPLRYDTQPDSVNMDSDESMMTCARIRPFKSSKVPNRKEEKISEESAHESGHVDEPEPGEYTHGPSKRLEVVSECKWDRRTDRTYIMRVLCEHMDKDRLKTPFWIGKYRIQPISQTVVDEGQGPCTNYKVLISQPQLGLLKEKIQTHVGSQPPAPPVESTVPAAQRLSDLQRPASVPRPEQKPIPRPEPGPEQRAELGQKPGSRPKQKAEPPLKHRSIEPLPKLRPDQGLPFLAGVPTAGLLIAQQKAGESCPIMVNGKSYPIAKLQLGHMGALHPANRLAAYITGRLDPVNLPGYPKSQDQATTMASSTVATPGGDVNTSVTKATATPLPPKATGEVSLVVVFMVADRGSGKYYFGEM